MKKRSAVKFRFEKLNKLPKWFLTCLTEKFMPLLKNIQKNIHCNNVQCKQYRYLFSRTVLMILRKVLSLSWSCHSLVIQFILLLRILLIVKSRLNQRVKSASWGVCWRDGPKHILNVINYVHTVGKIVSLGYTKVYIPFLARIFNRLCVWIYIYIHICICISSCIQGEYLLW